MELKTKSPKEVAEAIQTDLLSRPLTIAEAARTINRTPQSLYNILRGEFRIGAKMATTLHKTFGYSKAFMMQGIGELKDESQDYNELEEDVKNAWGLYFSDDSLFTNREQLLNTICKVLSEAFYYLNKKLPLRLILNPDYPTLDEIGFTPQSDIEERLATTITQMSSLLAQVADARTILNSPTRKTKKEREHTPESPERKLINFLLVRQAGKILMTDTEEVFYENQDIQSEGISACTPGSEEEIEAISVSASRVTVTLIEYGESGDGHDDLTRNVPMAELNASVQQEILDFITNEFENSNKE